MKKEGNGRSKSINLVFVKNILFQFVHKKYSESLNDKIM